MAKQFKVDTLGCGKDVLRLAGEGRSSYYIVDWLWQVKQFRIDHKSITRYCERHGVSLSDNPSVKEVKQATESIGEAYEIDIEAYKKLWDIPERMDSPEKIIAVIQRATAEIHILNSIITHAGLKAYLDGIDRYPKQQINGLKITHEVLSQSWGLSQTIDVNAALSTLEKHGEMDAIRLIEET